MKGKIVRTAKSWHKYFYIILVLTIGCADSHQLVKTTTNQISLEKTKPILILTPKDGQYGGQSYTGSGVTTAQIITSSFAKYTLQIDTIENKDFNSAISYAKDKNYYYLVYPLILHWEDRATEWSGISDKVSVKISILDVNTGSELDSIIIEGKSGLATFGGDHPQDLLPKPIGEYVKSLFQSES